MRSTLYDVLFLDYGLFDLSGDGHFLTGNQAAYSGAYLRVGYIVVLNQFGTHQFDLSMVQDFESKGDLDIGDSQIANPRLWREPFSGFRPWHWPVLPRQVEAQRRREAEVEETLDDEVSTLEFLGFNEAATRLPDPALLSYLTGRNAKERNPEKIGFRDFVFESGSGLERRDAEALARTDRADTEKLVARIAAARIHKWLDRMVLGSQGDPLVDAPHLTERLPSVLQGNLKKIDNWSKTASLDKEA